MKNLIAIVAMLAVALSFLPKAEADDTARLDLTVAFKMEPLKLWAEPSGPFSIQEGEELKFKVIAEDLDAVSVSLSAGELPKGATFVLAQYYAPTNHMEGTFTWTPAVGQAQDAAYEVEFKARSSNEETGLGIVIKILVLPQPVISIELNPTTWILEGVKLGEIRRNVDPYGQIIHSIKNTGNVNVSVDIGYGLFGPLESVDVAANTITVSGKVIPVRYYIVVDGHPVTLTQLAAILADAQANGKVIWLKGIGASMDFVTKEAKQVILPGLEQGLNRFITMVVTTIIPPDRKVAFASIPAGGIKALDLGYGAPTAISGKVDSMAAMYEIRAYPPIYGN